MFGLGARGATDAEGSRIGLAFVRLILQRAGGRVQVEDSLLGGPRFIVVIPPRADPKARTDSTHPRSVHNPSLRFGGSSQREPRKVRAIECKLVRRGGKDGALDSVVIRTLVRSQTLDRIVRASGVALDVRKGTTFTQALVKEMSMNYGTSSTQGGTTNPSTGSPLIGSDRVEGTAVYDPAGKQIGTIKRLVIDKVSGQVAYAVMSFGGFLGMGANEFPVPWRKLDYDTTLGGFRTDITEEQLRKAPTLNRLRDGGPSDDFDWSDRSREQQLYDYYGVKYYWPM